MNLRYRYLRMFPWALIFLSITIVSAVHAAHDLFQSIDKNADGTVNQEEFSEDMKEYVFDELDRDHDNMISKSEWMSIADVLGPKEHEELFQSIDMDRDKRITFFEFSDYAESNANLIEAFIGLDKDGSNTLSPDEITARPLFRMITIRIK